MGLSQYVGFLLSLHIYVVDPICKVIPLWTGMFYSLKLSSSSPWLPYLGGMMRWAGTSPLACTNLEVLQSKKRWVSGKSSFTPLAGSHNFILDRWAALTWLLLGLTIILNVNSWSKRSHLLTLVLSICWRDTIVLNGLRRRWTGWQEGSAGIFELSTPCLTPPSQSYYNSVYFQKQAYQQRRLGGLVLPFPLGPRLP